MNDAGREPVFEFTVEGSFADYYRFTRCAQWRVMRWVYALAGLLLTSFLISPLLATGSDATIWEIYTSGAASLTFPLLILVGVPLLIYLGCRHRFAKTPWLNEPRTFRFDSTGFDVAGRDFSGRVGWTNVTAAESDGVLLWLNMGQGQYYYFPLAAAGDAERFKSFVRTHVADCHRL